MGPIIDYSLVKWHLTIQQLQSIQPVALRSLMRLDENLQVSKSNYVQYLIYNSNFILRLDDW